LFLFIIEVVRGFKNIEVASSLSTEMYVYVCVAHIARAADRPTNCGAGRSRGSAAGRPRGRGRGRSGAAAGRSRGGAAAGRSHGGAATGRSRGGAAAGPSRGGAAAGPSRGGADYEAPFLSYGDDDVPNVLPRFDSSDVGFRFPGYLTRGSLREAKDFFELFFDDSIVNIA